MEERTSTEFPTAGGPGATSGLSRLEATERGDTRGYEGGNSGSHDMGARAREYASVGRDQAKKFGSMARERAIKQADTRKSHFASQLDNFAGTLEEVSRTLEDRGDDTQKEWVDRGAKLVRNASKEIRSRSTEELFDTAQRQVKSKPELAMLGAFALGFLGIRLLRS